MNRFATTGEGKTHLYPTSLFIEFTFKAKEGQGKANLHKLGYIRASYVIDYFNNLLNRE